MSKTINFSSTSSGPNGWSSLSGFLECPARAMASRRERLANPNTPWPLDEEQKNKPVNTAVGSIYGELMQRWMKGEPASPSAKFTWDGVDIEESHPATCAEARRLIDKATAHYGSLEQMAIGELVATEMPITIPESLFGLEITGAIDLVLRTPAGILIRDLKTEGREEQNLFDKFSLRQQLWIYALGYELTTGEKPIGVGIECCIKTSEPKFRRYDYEGVTPKRFDWLASSIAKVRAAMETPSPDPRLPNCWDYFRPCRFLVAGMCSLG